MTFIEQYLILNQALGEIQLKNELVKGVRVHPCEMGSNLELRIDKLDQNSKPQDSVAFLRIS